MTIRHFQDKANKTALPVINLIDAMRPGTVNFDIVNPTPVTGEDLNRLVLGSRNQHLRLILCLFLSFMIPLRCSILRSKPVRPLGKEAKFKNVLFIPTHSNAKYAITLARMIGAPVYALPEDLTEVKHKMVMTVFASLMLVDFA